MYVINLDKYSDIGTHSIALYVKNNDITIYIQAYIIQAYDSIMCGYFCIGFIDFILKRKTLTEYTNFFLPNDFKKNDNVILNYFMSNTYV